MASTQQTGAAGIPKESRARSISSMARSPAPSSPVAPEMHDSQPRIATPLRTTQKANTSVSGDGNTYTLLPSPIVVVSPTLKDGESGDEFPFTSPPGTSGILPTNDLSQQESASKARSTGQGEDSDRATDLNTAAIGGLSRKQTRELGSVTPQGRRSVQFAREGTLDEIKGPSEQAGHSREQSWAAENAPEGTGKEKLGSQLMSKLKALTPLQGHGRTLSGWSMNRSNTDERPTPASPEHENSEMRFGEYEADAEESAAEGSGTGPAKTKKRRRFRRDADEGPSTAPTTPRAGRLPPFRHDTEQTPPTSAPHSRPNFMPRRNTMSDIPENQRIAISEDEGRDRLAAEGLWRRGSAWVSGHRGLSYNTGSRQHRSDDTIITTDSKRPSGLRRLTAFAQHDADGSPSPWRARGERATSMSAQRWRQIKAGLKMLGARKREENRVEAAKSAELMAELLAGAPAALFLASMFQRDVSGHKRVPVLLEQLRVKVTDSTTKTDSDRKSHVFRIELEYGSSLARMKWVVHRDLSDFARLHANFRTEEGGQNIRHLTRRSERSKMPKFPKSIVPLMGDFFASRGIKDEESEDEGHTAEEQSGMDGEMSGTDRPGKARRRRSSFQLLRRKTSRLLGPGGIDGAASSTGNTSFRKETIPERQRRKMEEYTNKLVTYVMFRPNSNRLCKFLEISALGVRLASEGYHGKEGLLSIKSTRGVDYRKPFPPKFLKFRPATFKWFLVRQSYLVCVDSLENMNIYDVILVDTDFSVERKKTTRKRDETAKDLARRAKDTARHPTHHQLKVNNTERLWKLTAKNETVAMQFEESIKFMRSQTEWAIPHRFDSFAPVRKNVWAQYLVDGRDYMWNVSRAISMARDVIYIHDWWLSPQLYMRRPAAISQRWRLDRLLKRKADEGVKIYVIMYRNINSAIPIDSEYSKFSLLALNPEGKNNVFVQRSPNQLRQNTFFWAHHEKICVIDHCVAFCGGVDLCFGRLDLPSHPLVDDKATGFELGDEPRDGDNCQLWPGKDYSNPRVQDFFNLDRPYEEMYNREKVPRMPWHDIGMQIVGQPARDLSRHFVQRWNFLLRQRTPTRPTPFLLPPTDFLPADIEALGLEGTCEIQMLRSACPWSLGTPNKTECSILNAYLDMIKNSDHFVYIENQFYISSCEVMGRKVENGIGDALVERIIRAYEEEEYWRAVILIPLMPGFQNAIDAQDGSSVRIIMECQYKSICRGPTSIFGRLRSRGIEPEDYIEFYALRSHGKIGPTKALVTEQLYIHAKVMVVDDRIAIIGSANINERSMLGSRDSEVAAIVRDTDMIPSKMAGEDYHVAKFAHGLRMRLMREHLGLDVDKLRDEEMEDAQMEEEMDRIHGENRDHDFDAESVASVESDRAVEQRLINNKHRFQEDLIAKQEQLHTFNHDVDWSQANNPHIMSTRKKTKDTRIANNEEFKKDLIGLGPDKMLEHDVEANDQDARDTQLVNGREVLVSNLDPEGRGTPSAPKKNKEQIQARYRAAHVEEEAEPAILPPPSLPHMNTHELGLPQVSILPSLPAEDDTDIGGPPLQRSISAASMGVLNPFLQEMRRPVITPNCMQDPVVDTFFSDVWQTVAENNTKIFRQVFRCQPDTEVKSWQQYKEYTAFSERFAQSQGLGRGGKSAARAQQDASKGKSGPPGDAFTPPPASMESIVEKLSGVTGGKRDNNLQGNVEDWTEEQEKQVQQGEAIFSDKSGNPKTSSSKTDGVDTRDFHISNGNGKDSPNSQLSEKANGKLPDTSRNRTVTISEPARTRDTNTLSMGKSNSTSIGGGGSQRKKRRRSVRSTHRPFHADDDGILLETADAEELLKLVQGHLVLWPYDWLADADEKGQFVYAVDQLAPLELYN